MTLYTYGKKLKKYSGYSVRKLYMSDFGNTEGCILT